MSINKNHSEQELTALLREGNETAFVEIYRRNWQRMYNTAYKRLKDAYQCEDLVQNIFTDLWERRTEILIGNLQAYLQTAVKFQVIKYSTRTSDVSPFVEILETTLASADNTDDPIIENELSELVRLWVAALPEKRREIFVLYYMEEHSSHRIAELLGISQKTVQNQLATAANALRSQLSKVLLVSLILQLPSPMME
ncbi:MAG: sigma-70 family RNA polymerase sigma factor [Spirosomataceae bacterium]